MQKKLTITIDEKVYDGLHATIGRGRIAQFMEDLVRPYVLKDELAQQYIEAANDAAREADIAVWADDFNEDVDAPW